MVDIRNAGSGSKGSAYPLEPNATYLGKVAMVHADNTVSVEVRKINSTFDRCKVVGSPLLQPLLKGDRVVCGLLDGLKQELVVYGRYDTTGVLNAISINDEGTIDLSGNVIISAENALTFEGATNDGYETTITVVDPTADRTITLPDVTGTVITTGNLSAITSVGTLSSLALTGDLVVDTNTLKVDSTNNRVGIGTVSPSTALQVVGTVTATAFTGALTGNVSGTATTVTTNANLTGDVTSVGNATTLTNAPVIAKVLTGYASGAGTVAATDSILQAIQKLNGNNALKADIASPTFTGTPTLPAGTIATTQTAADSSTKVATTAFVTTADNLKANIASPTFTGTPLSTTAAVDTNTTQIATTAYVVGQGYAKLASPTFTGTVTVPTPTNSTDAVTKAYADAITQSLDIKDSVRVASTANIVIASALINGSTIDGVVVATGDRVLLKNQTTATENGIYVVVASGAASRSTDANTSAKVTSGMYVFVSEGTVSADMGYVLITNDPITLGVGGTALTFTQFSGAGQISAGDGLTKTGNTLNVVGTAARITANADSIDIASTYVGQSSITTLGTVSTGVWQGTAIAGQYGGTGVANTGKTVTLGGNLTTSGAFATTLTATATTTVTLPTTGTLATLAGTETLTNKTLTSPVVNTPTGIVKGDVGLGNVDNTSNATERAATATLTNKTLTTPVINGTITGTGQASANTVSTIVMRDASGNFAAGTITAALIGNASTATNVAYTGLTGTVPTWNQNTTGTAATVTGASQTAITSLGTLTELLVGKTASTATVAAANDTGSFSVRGNATYPAVMSFHRTGSYAVNFGLSTDNKMELGGWSATTIKHTWDMSGNYDAVGTVTAAGLTTTGNVRINNTSPTIYLKDTDHRSAMIHVNSNLFYVLRGNGNNSETWEQVSSQWPLVINLENNNATVGNNVLVNNNGNAPIITVGNWSANSAFSAVETSKGYLLLGALTTNDNVYLRSKTASTYVYIGAEGENTLAVGNGSTTATSVAGLLTATSIWNTSAATTTLTNFQYVVRSTSGYPAYYYYTSVREGKRNIVKITDSGTLIDQLNPVTYQAKITEDDDELSASWKDNDLEYGFIAEEVAEVGTGFLAQYSDDGEGNLKPAGWKFHGVVSVLVAEVKELRKRVTELEASQ